MAICKISIIIPAYNAEGYLGETLKSVASQEDMPDELILIDDGSTDDTLAVAHSFSFPFPYKILSVKNSGQGPARNLGVSLATSEYVYFLDSDDLIRKNFIGEIKKYISIYGDPDIVLFSGESFNDINYQGTRWMNYKRGISGYFVESSGILETLYSCGGLFCQPCLYITKRKLWGNNKLEFGSNYLEDEAIFYPLLFSCRNYLVLDQIYFGRRNREGSTMTVVPSLKHANGALNCMQKYCDIYLDHATTFAEQRYIKKRLVGHASAYIVYCRELGLEFPWVELFKVINRIQSLSLLIRVIVFYLKLDQVGFVKQMYKMLFSKSRINK